MTEAVNRFYSSIDDAESLSQGELAAFFVYFLTVELGQDGATAKEIETCFSDVDLPTPKNVSARLSEGLKSKPAKFLKGGAGYKLQRHYRQALSSRLGAELVTAQTSTTLRSLEHSIPDGAAKSFLKETVDCFEAGANRATVVMVWLLTVDHLYSFVLQHKLSDFNIALSKDKGVKLNAIRNRDDFADLKESKFVELCRAAKIISNDVRKVLEAGLGLRNSAAHPSGVKIPRSKVIATVEDLVENVLVKYKL